ncbi:MAG: Gfo/Idh/MocA family oxidoreductase [Chloroflexota bacterium]
MREIKEQGEIGLGLVGVGGFGRFCLQAYSKLPGLRLVAVCDSNQERLKSVAEEFGMKPYTDYEAMLADPDVGIVAVNTPPSSHGPMVIAAAQAGKHIFCEKPLATDLAAAEAALLAAHKAGVTLSIDYVMRHNPLYRLLERLTALEGNSGAVLGALRRFAIENFAADENLNADHWFWDESLSGGIFVEHGVHFFDLAGWHLGRAPKRVVALATGREGLDPSLGSRTTLPGKEVGRPLASTGSGREEIVDTVQAVVEYDGGATGSFYHSFTRANAAEHQSITYGWDWATATLRGWIALNLVLDAWIDDEGLAALREIAENKEGLRIANEAPLPGAFMKLQVVESFPNGCIMRGRAEDRRVTTRVRLIADLGREDAKPLVYEQSVRAGMSDLLDSIRVGRVPCVSGVDAWSSTATAVAARQAAATRREVLLSTMPASISQIDTWNSATNTHH